MEGRRGMGFDMIRPRVMAVRHGESCLCHESLKCTNVRHQTRKYPLKPFYFGIGSKMGTRAHIVE